MPLRTRVTLPLLLTLAACTRPAAVTAPSPLSISGDTVADQLFFGRSIPGSSETVSDSAWSQFLREVVTPRFPAGLTVLQAQGQWREDDGRIAREQSLVLEIVHPASAETEDALRAIAEEYKRRFRQEAVMRVTLPVRMRFYEE